MGDRLRAGLLIAAHPNATHAQLTSAIERSAQRIRGGVRFGRIAATAAFGAIGAG